MPERAAASKRWREVEGHVATTKLQSDVQAETSHQQAEPERGTPISLIQTPDPDREHESPSSKAEVSELSDLTKAFSTPDKQEPHTEREANSRPRERLPNGVHQEMERADSGRNVLTAEDEENVFLPVKAELTQQKDGNKFVVSQPYMSDTSEDSLDEHKEVRNLKRRMTRRAKVRNGYSTASPSLTLICFPS